MVSKTRLGVIQTHEEHSRKIETLFTAQIGAGVGASISPCSSVPFCCILAVLASVGKPNKHWDGFLFGSGVPLSPAWLVGRAQEKFYRRSCCLNPPGDGLSIRRGDGAPSEVVRHRFVARGLHRLDFPRLVLCFFAGSVAAGCLDIEKGFWGGGVTTPPGLRAARASRPAPAGGLFCRFTFDVRVVLGSAWLCANEWSPTRISDFESAKR